MAYRTCAPCRCAYGAVCGGHPGRQSGYFPTWSTSMEASWGIQSGSQAGLEGGQFPEQGLNGVPFSAHRCSADHERSHIADGSPL